MPVLLFFGLWWYLGKRLVDHGLGGGLMSIGKKQVANARRADADEHLYEFQAGNRKERDPSFARNAGERADPPRAAQCVEFIDEDDGGRP